MATEMIAKTMTDVQDEARSEMAKTLRDAALAVARELDLKIVSLLEAAAQ